MHRLGQLEKVVGVHLIDEAVLDEGVDDAVQRRGIGQDLAGERSAQQRREEQLLAFDAPVVTVALGVDGAGAYVVEGSFTADLLLTGLGEDGAQLEIVERDRRADLDTTDLVHDLLETREVHRDEVVDVQAADRGECVDDALGAAVAIGGVELGARLGGHDLAGVFAFVVIPRCALGTVDLQVPRETHRDHAAAVGRDVHEDHRVRPGTAGVFGGTGADLPVLSRPGVGADDQVGFVAGLQFFAADLAVVRVDGIDDVPVAVFDLLVAPYRARAQECHDAGESEEDSATHPGIPGQRGSIAALGRRGMSAAAGRTRAGFGNHRRLNTVGHAVVRRVRIRLGIGGEVDGWVVLGGRDDLCLGVVVPLRRVGAREGMARRARRGGRPTGRTAAAAWVGIGRGTRIHRTADGLGRGIGGADAAWARRRNRRSVGRRCRGTVCRGSGFAGRGLRRPVGGGSRRRGWCGASGRAGGIHPIE